MRIFLDSDKGAPSGGGGSATNPAQQQGGAKSDEGSVEIKDPTAGLDLDDYDPATRKILEDSRAGFATLQKQSADREAARLLEEKQRKQFQSQHDQLAAQVQKLTGQQGQQQQTDPATAQLSKFTDILVKRGVPAEQAKVQAEIMQEMMGDFGKELKDQIGRDLSPFANSVVSREAEFAWNNALTTDKLGAMQIAEVQTQAWAQVQTLVQQGQQVTPQVVKNLVGMAYYEHLEKGGAQAATPPSTMQPPQFQQMGRLGAPGGQAMRPNVPDPNAPRTVLDPDTDAALQVVMGKWASGQGGVKAPGLRAKGGK